jgi:hypothetical protein
MSKISLKVLILLESAETPAWQYYCIEQLLAIPNISLQLLLCQRPSHSSQAVLQPGLLFRVLDRAQSRKHVSSIDAFSDRTVTDLFEDWIDIPVAQASARNSSDSINNLLSQLANESYDIIIALGRVDIISSLIGLSRLGVWFLRHDFDQTVRSDGRTVGFFEVIQRQPTLRSSLAIAGAHGFSTCLEFNTYSAVHQLSHVQTRKEHFWKLLHFFPRAIDHILRYGIRSLFDRATVVQGEPCPWQSSSGNRLTLLRTTLPVAKYLLWRALRKIRTYFFNERWILLFSKSASSTELSKFKLIFPPNDRFWADPHLLKHQEKFYVYFEDASLKTGHGRISVLEIDPDGEFSDPKPVIEKPYHLSYPFTFSWNNESYIIPESADNRTIELYRVVRYPSSVEFVHNLMTDISAYDATLVEHNGRWWMFATVSPHPGASTWDELCVFYAESPISTVWKPHRLNPVVSDVRRARPGGRFLKESGQLYRLSQNCSYRYGYGINITRITELSVTGFEETLVRKITPASLQSIKAIHTFTQAGSLTMLDGMYHSLRNR